MIPAPYTGFGPTPLHADVFLNGCFAAEVGGSGQTFSGGLIAERLLTGMLEHAQPVALLAGDTLDHWDHVSDVIEALLSATARQRMLVDGEAHSPGIVVEVEVMPDLDVLAARLGPELVQRCCIKLLAASTGPDVVRACRRAMPLDFVLMVSLDAARVERSEVARFQRALERRTYGYGRGVRVEPRRRSMPWRC